MTTRASSPPRNGMALAPVVATAALVAAGAVAWILSYFDLHAGSDRAMALNSLGASLLTGAVVSGAFVWLGARQGQQRDRDALLLQLALSPDLSGIDLRDRKLHGVYLGGKVLRHANFAGADLTDASFYSSDLSDASFTGATLVRVDFGAAVLTRANLVDSDAQAADFSFANIDAAVFVGARLADALFSPEQQHPRA